QGAEHLLDGEGDLLLDLLRSQGRGHSVDLHLYGRRVRESIDVEPAQREPADHGAGQCRHDDQKAMPQRKVDNPIEHSYLASVVSCPAMIAEISRVFSLPGEGGRSLNARLPRPHPSFLSRAPHAARRYSWSRQFRPAKDPQ